MTPLSIYLMDFVPRWAVMEAILGALVLLGVVVLVNRRNP